MRIFGRSRGCTPLLLDRDGNVYIRHMTFSRLGFFVFSIILIINLHYRVIFGSLPSLLLFSFFFNSPGGICPAFHSITLIPSSYHNLSLSLHHNPSLKMRYSIIVASSGLLATVSAHGLVTSIQGANGVTMPGLTVADGTPRDCSSNRCGSQADTAIMRDREMGSEKASALGRTQGNGPVDAAAMIENFMGGSAAPTNNGSAASVGVEDNIQGQEQKRGEGKTFVRALGDFLSGLTGGGEGEKTETAAETNVAASAGQGATSGLPTCADDGSVTMTFRQINQDGAGPMEAAIDGTSGGTDPDAFKTAEVTQDVPGVGFQGLSLATNTDFPLTVQMPAGMTCDASVGGADNVCVVRVRNGAGAGPFGGSAAFTMSPAAQKRALAYRMRKRSEQQSNNNNNRRLR
ncbi:hypothetical protein F4778DRAFT_756724 [Xylariomycetidae sp. FL2044]|nr:hypothetical protein F4778DRAFT_756724 [Xylariomycetidae sp. FL2044]